MTRTAIAIAAVVLRRPAVLVGRVVAVRAYVRPWVRLDVELSDGTGTVILRFMGRTEIAGLVPEVRLRVEGTPSMEDEAIVMLNPNYVFVPDEAQSE
jgi:hypothetical protein